MDMMKSLVLMIKFTLRNTHLMIRKISLYYPLCAEKMSLYLMITKKNEIFKMKKYLKKSYSVVR